MTRMIGMIGVYVSTIAM